MGDIALQFDLDQEGIDLGELIQNDLAQDEGLETAVIISLFSDHRVTREEAARDDTDLRGWWADSVDPLVETDSIGSKLWLLSREKSTDETLSRARQYCEEALQWLLDESVADSLTVETSYEDYAGDVKSLMLIDIQITRPEGDVVRFKFYNEWRNQTSAI